MFDKNELGKLSKETNLDQKKIINADIYEGSLLGTAIGDSIGLPFEGLSRKRIQRLMKIPLNHQFFFGYGMLSDDTEHTCIVAQSLISSSGEPEAFQKHLARKLKLWFLALPAGIGMATLKSSIKLCFGFSTNNRAPRLIRSEQPKLSKRYG